VLKIAKGACVSPAAFYQYFDSKETVFRKICDIFFDLVFDRCFRSLTRNGYFENNLNNLIDHLFDALWENRGVYKVFREAEFIDLKVGNTFCERFSKELDVFFEGSLSEEQTRAVFWFLWGPIYYLSGFWALWKEEPVSPEVRTTLKDFLYNGISKNDFSIDERVYSLISFSSEIQKTKSTRGELTKRKLLDAAETLFGKKGYNETGIHQICEAAGCSVGTFYVYFKTKVAILRELVRQTNRELRYQIKKSTELFSDRRNQEIAAYCGFLNFFSRHRYIYGIVREAEFVDSSISLSYYDSLQIPYEKALTEAITKKEIRVADVRHLASILMGIGHSIGFFLFLLGDKRDYNYKAELSPLSDLILFGFRAYHNSDRNKSNKEQ
jgi:AcrR family transcriptional regulator